MSIVNKQKVRLDDVLEKFGLFGRHQLLTLLLMSFAFIVNSIYCVNYVFSAQDVPYRCQIDECESRDELIFDVNWYNMTAPGDVYGTCHKYERLLNASTCSASTYNMSQLVPCQKWVYADNRSFVSEFDLACEDWKRTIVGTVHSIGLMVGLIIQGQLSDRLGRKTAVCFAGVSGGVFGLAKSYTRTFSLFITFEFLEATLGDVCSPSFILSIESVHGKYRLIYQAILSMLYALGGVVMAFVAWYLPYWRDYLRAIYAPSLLFILYIFFLDESVRWLLSKGKKKEAIVLLQKAAKRNNISIEDKMLVNLECDVDKDVRSPLLETFKSKIVVKRFLICVVWWSTCSFVYFGLMINSVSLDGNKYFNFALLSVPDIPASIAFAYLLKYFKRKIPLFFSFMTVSVLCVVQTFVSKDFVWLVTSLYFVGKVVITFTFATVYIFTSELFPTYTRNSMHALCSSVGRIGSTVAPLTPLLARYMESLPTILFGLCSLVAGLLTLLVPDTADEALPDNVRQAEVIGKAKETNGERI